VLLGEILVAGSVVAATAHFAGSSAAVFVATDYLASASGIVAVAPKMGGDAFASASTTSSFTVA
jgi:hypothetical protein